MTLGLAAFLSVVLVLAVLAGRWFRDRTPVAMALPDDQMAHLAAQAVEAARDAFDTTLDYETASVERVEAILRRLHNEHQARPFHRERLVGEANRWGAYVGEVARRIKGGEWHRGSTHVGKGTFPLVWGPEDEIYPCAWCFRRITNGPEDDVSIKFRLSVLADAKVAV